MQRGIASNSAYSMKTWHSVGMIKFNLSEYLTYRNLTYRPTTHCRITKKPETRPTAPDIARARTGPGLKA